MCKKRTIVPRPSENCDLSKHKQPRDDHVIPFILDWLRLALVTIGPASFPLWDWSYRFLRHSNIHTTHVHWTIWCHSDPHSYSAHADCVERLSLKKGGSLASPPPKQCPPLVNAFFCQSGAGALEAFDGWNERVTQKSPRWRLPDADVPIGWHRLPLVQ